MIVQSEATRGRRARLRRRRPRAVAQEVVGDPADPGRRGDRLCRRQPGHAQVQVGSAHPDRRPRERLPASGGREAGATATARSIQETVTSQVQLVLSRDLARQVIKDLKLGELPEFDPVLRGISPLRHVLTLVGLAKDPLTMTPEERVLEAYNERLTAYSGRQVAGHRRRVPVGRSGARRTRRQRGGGGLSRAPADGKAGPDPRREPVARRRDRRAAQARSPRPKPRSRSSAPRSNLFVGTNNTSLSNQQLGELNSQIGVARSQKADAESKAKAIREMLKSGQPIESADIINSELIRRLSEQRVTLRAQLAEQSSTLLDNHPRIKELKAQIADLDRQIRGEAERLVALARERRPHRRRAARVAQPASTSSSARRPPPTGRTWSCARSSAKPRRSATCSNPISPSIARRRRATASARCRRCAHHLARRGVQYAVFPQEAADRADRDAGDAVDRDRLRHHRRAAGRQCLSVRRLCGIGRAGRGRRSGTLPSQAVSAAIPRLAGTRWLKAEAAQEHFAVPEDDA